MAKRKKAGRKPLAGGREKFTTTLPSYVIRHLRYIGAGNASAGICRLVDRDKRVHEYVDCPHGGCLQCSGKTDKKL